MSASPGPTIQLGDLNPRQLRQIVLDLEQTIKALQVQYEALATGQKRFEASQKAMEETCSAPNDAVLIPMTASVYQEGDLTDKTKFIVDIGAGYLLERNVEAHRTYFKKRINQIATSLSKISSLMHERKLLLEQCSLLLQKKLSEQQPANPTAAQAAATAVGS